MLAGLPSLGLALARGDVSANQNLAALDMRLFESGPAFECAPDLPAPVLELASLESDDADEEDGDGLTDSGVDADACSTRSARWELSAPPCRLNPIDDQRLIRSCRGHARGTEHPPRV